jgi:FAD/FMN-containing dehydrogenase/Fe-S oxidoreductase
MLCGDARHSFARHFDFETSPSSLCVSHFVQEQQRIIDDLTGLLEGELRVDPIALTAYATDASLYQLRPLGVAYPKSREDVVTIVRYARERSIPVIARGSGTGVAGGAIGRGIVLDFSRHMTSIEAIGHETVRVQPGVVRDKLNAALRPYGRYLPPDPSTSVTTTVGGMIGVDAAGSHAVRVGSMRDYVPSMEVVLASGQMTELGREPIPQVQRAAADDGEETPLESPSGIYDPRRLLIARVAQLLRQNRDLIVMHQTGLIRNCAGYYFRGVMREKDLDLPRLLVGSEGTLAITTAATLNTAPLPAHRGVVMLLFGNIETALKVAQGVMEEQPSACDLLDRRLLSLGREDDPRFEALISKSAEAALLIEQTGYSEQQVLDRLRRIVKSARNIDETLLVAKQATSEAEVEFLWSLPARVVPLLIQLKGPVRPFPLFEAIAVPPPNLHEFLVLAQRVLQKYEVTASLYAHAASGQVHLRPFLPTPRPQDGAKLEALVRELYEVAFQFKGTVSGEHGDGLSRTAFLRSQYGPMYRIIQQVKEIFDPHNLLNPGKIVSDDPHATIRDLRPVEPRPDPETAPLQLSWTLPIATEAANRCNGCGICRTQDPGSRMCPFFRLDQVEEAAPRSKANVVRNYLTGGLAGRDLASDEAMQLAKKCFNCKQCQIECPSNVDIPHLMMETRAAYVEANGLTREDWILARAHSFGSLGSTLAPLANWALNNGGFRWLMEKLLRISRYRKLPPFARRTFLRQVKRTASLRDLVGGGKRPVVYFVDHFANYHDPDLGRAFLEIMRHHGIPVYVPPGQTATGMAMVTAGDLDSAREMAERNVRELAELAREGLPIVCTEPAAVVCLTQDYPLLLNHPDVETVASRVIEAGAFLKQMKVEGRLRTDFQTVNVTAGYHTPCHIRALKQGTPFADLLADIPGVTLRRIEEGCSGMAGAFGLTAANFETSLQIGKGLIERMQRDDILIGTTECGSCKLQMEQGTTRPTIHPLKILALAYGLMPELKRLLRPNKRRLMTS